MSDQKAQQVSSPQESSRTEGKVEAQLGAATPPSPFQQMMSVDANPDDKRLLLYEVLLDEYESLAQPHLHPSLMKEIKDEIRSIRAEGERFKETCEKLPEKKQRNLPQEKQEEVQDQDEYEEEFNGRLTKRVYAVLRRAQNQTASIERYIEELDHTITDDDRKRIIKAVLAQEISGKLEVSRKLLKEAQTGSDALTIDHAVEKQLIADIRAEIRNPKTSTESLAQVEGQTEPSTNGGTTSGGNGTRGLDGNNARLGTLLAQTQRSALCLSGGGIRSATFNLGILQGLARYGLLGRFDYLSTVSGGGFVGGWLSAWIHRKGLNTVMQGLKETPDSPLEPEAKPIIHLRNYSNFLSPKLGLLYADTWALVATLLRNMVLTWLVFIPFLMAVLMLPRLWNAFLHRNYFDNRMTPGTISAWLGQFVGGLIGVSNSELVCIVVGYLTGWLSLIYIGTHLPSTEGKDNREGSFFIWCLAPMIISTMAFSMFWLRLKQRGASLTAAIPFLGWQSAPDTPTPFILFGITLIAVPWLVCIFYRLAAPGLNNLVNFVLASSFASLLIAIAQLVNGFLLWYVAIRLFNITGSDYDSRIYAIFAVPILLAIWSLSGILMAGFTSRFTRDEDLEWWARAGAWVMIVTVSWVLINLLVLYAPSWFVSLSKKLQYPLTATLNWQDKLKLAGGIFSIVMALYGGFSSKTPANPQQAKKAGLMGKLMQILINLFALIAMAFLLIMIVIATNIILTRGSAPFIIAANFILAKGSIPVISVLNFISNQDIGLALSPYLTISRLPYLMTDHQNILLYSGVRFLCLMTFFMAALSVFMGWLINTNRFSLHYLWRNRIIRAYLGASREVRNPNLFTGFDTDDNVPMYKLRPDQPGAPPPTPESTEEKPPPQSKKLLHILNIALNLTGSSKLAWQDRKSESLTVSPLHCGSYWLGYRRSWRYGGTNDLSITLGTAVAISGAFVSPNMGYMMTSPVLRFLMALFNVRFGWWLGNPGRAGEGFVPTANTFNHMSPLLSVKPIVQEAFGMINDKSDYVYLSDGGHFENLGIYEMVLRRCRFIVVSDASTDADYTFGSLAMSIRQIRVDLGVPIEMRDFSILNQSEDRKGKYCSIGTIRYSCVDGGTPDESDGVLIYIKAALIGSEPRDVLNYSKESGDFPQEIIVDQWFSEAQFESYRALGSHIIRVICGEDEKPLTFTTFLHKVREHNRLDYDVFKEQISYAAFEHQFKEDMAQAAPLDFKEKVKKYIEQTLGENEK